MTTHRLEIDHVFLFFSPAAASGLTLQQGEGPAHGQTLDLSGVDGSVARTLSTPDGRR